MSFEQEEDLHVGVSSASAAAVVGARLVLDPHIAHACQSYFDTEGVLTNRRSALRGVAP